MAKWYQAVLGSLHSKLFFCILLCLSSRYLKQNLRVIAYFLLTSDLKCPSVTNGHYGHWQHRGTSNRS